jgi:hypothetical protein
VSESVHLDQPTILEASGHARVARPGQRIKLVVLERRDGRTIGHWAVRLIFPSKRWGQLPTLRYMTRGDSSVQVKLKMRSRTGRYFWADDLRLVAR